MQVMKEPAGKLAKPSTSILDASPVFSSRTKPRVEEMKEKVKKGTEYGLVYDILYKNPFNSRCGRRVCAVQASLPA